MPRHTGTVSRGVFDRLRWLDRRLHVFCSRQSVWAWVISIAGFAAWVAILVVAGVMTGVSAAEYIPTALVEGLVISGLLLLACMAPEGAPPPNDRGDPGPDTEPPSTPPGFDRSVWQALLADSAVEAVPADEVRKEERLPDPVGAAR